MLSSLSNFRQGRRDSVAYRKIIWWGRCFNLPPPKIVPFSGDTLGNFSIRNGILIWNVKNSDDIQEIFSDFSMCTRFSCQCLLVTTTPCAVARAIHKFTCGSSFSLLSYFALRYFKLFLFGHKHASPTCPPSGMPLSFLVI